MDSYLVTMRHPKVIIFQIPNTFRIARQEFLQVLDIVRGKVAKDKDPLGHTEHGLVQHGHAPGIDDSSDVPMPAPEDNLGHGQQKRTVYRQI